MGNQNTIDNAVTHAEVLFTHFLVEHNIHVSASDHAGPLFRAMFLQDKFSAEDIIRKYSCARTKTTCIVNKLAEIETTSLVQAMQAGPYSLATDASNDKNEKLFPVVVRMEKDGAVQTRLLSILELKAKGTGENVAQMILKDLESKSVPLKNCLALTTDNANVMVGKRSGLYGQLLQHHPDLYSTGCICHRIHLAAEWASKCLPRNVSSFFVDIYFYMDKSANRMNAFKSIQEECGTPITEVPKHVPTRWLSLATTCDWVLQQWEPLTKFFEMECSVDSSTARELQVESSQSCRKTSALDSLRSKTMKLCVAYLSYVLPVFNAANLVFQKEDAQIHRQRRIMLRLLSDLLTMFVKPSAMVYKLATEVDYKSPYNMESDKDIMVGQQCRELLSLVGSPRDAEFSKSVKKFLSTAVTYLIKNLPISDPVLLHAEVADISTRASASFSAVQHLVTKFPAILPPDSSLDCLEKQFKAYQRADVPSAIEQLPTSEEQWQKLGLLKDDLGDILLPHLPRIMLRILSIPHSNASCERMFSLVRKNRTEFRANMSVETLESLITLKQSAGTCYLQKPDKKVLNACKGATAERLAPSFSKQ